MPGQLKVLQSMALTCPTTRHMAAQETGLEGGREGGRVRGREGGREGEREGGRE